MPIFQTIFSNIGGGFGSAMDNIAATCIPLIIGAICGFLGCRAGYQCYLIGIGSPSLQIQGSIVSTKLAVMEVINVFVGIIGFINVWNNQESPWDSWPHALGMVSFCFIISSICSSIILNPLSYTQRAINRRIK